MSVRVMLQLVCWMMKGWPQSSANISGNRFRSKLNSTNFTAKAASYNKKNIKRLFKLQIFFYWPTNAKTTVFLKAKLLKSFAVSAADLNSSFEIEKVSGYVNIIFTSTYYLWKEDCTWQENTGKASEDMFTPVFHLYPYGVSSSDEVQQ